MVLCTHALVTYKNEDQMKIKGARVVTLYSSRAANSMADCPVWSKIKVIQVISIVLVICKNGVDPFKNEGAKVVTAYILL